MVFYSLMSSGRFFIIPGMDLILEIRINELGVKTFLILSNIVLKSKADHITGIVK